MYGNSKSTVKYGGDVRVKTAPDVGFGRAIVCPITRVKDIVGLWISSVGVMEKEKL